MRDLKIAILFFTVLFAPWIPAIILFNIVFNMSFDNYEHSLGKKFLDWVSKP